MPEIDPVILQLKAENGRYLAELRNTTRIADQQLTRHGKSVKNLENQITRSFRIAAGAAVSYLGAIGVIGAAREFLRLADSAKQLEAQLKLATRETGSFAQAQSDVRRIAAESRGELDATARLYSVFQRNSINLGIAQEDAARATETLTKAFKISGATATETSAATRQFIQGIQSGTLRGDEFNSVMEQAPRLQKLIVEAFNETSGAVKITENDLRGLAEQGKITSDVLLRALTGKEFTKSIDEEFSELPVTFGEAMQQVENAATITFGAFDKGGRISEMIVNFLTGATSGFADLESQAFDTGASIRAGFSGLEAVFRPLVDSVNALAGAFGNAQGEAITLRQEISALLGFYDDLANLFVLYEGNKPRSRLSSAQGRFDRAYAQSEMDSRRRAGRTPVSRLLQGLSQANQQAGVEPRAPRPAATTSEKTKGRTGSTGRSAETAARRAETERLRAIRDAAANQREQAQIEDDLLAARAALAVASQDILAFELQMIDREKQARIDDLGTQLKLGEIGEKELIERTSLLGQIAEAKKVRARLAKAEADEALGAEAVRDETRTRSIEARLTETRKERFEVEKGILDLAYQEEEFAIRRAHANGEIADLDEALARLRRRQLAEAEQLRRDTEGPLARYSRRLNNPGHFRDEAEALVIDELESVRDGISDALSKAIGTKDPLIAGLIRLLIDQILIRPIAEALARGQGGIGGFFSSVLGSIFGGFRASGGPVQAGRPYIVGENGPELMVPSRSGQVVPNHRLASGGQQVTVVQNITVDARNSVNPEGFERRILALSGQQAQAAYHGAVRDTPALMAKRQRFG